MVHSSSEVYKMENRMPLCPHNTVAVLPLSVVLFVNVPSHTFNTGNTRCPSEGMASFRCMVNERDCLWVTEIEIEIEKLQHCEIVGLLCR